MELDLGAVLQSAVIVWPQSNRLRYAAFSWDFLRFVVDSLAGQSVTADVKTRRRS
jgi:hypothetical protein